MEILFLLIAGIAIFYIAKGTLKETMEIFLESKPKKKSKCKIYLFPVWETSNFENLKEAENGKF